MDHKWDEVMALAREYGFIIKAYGGTAILVTHKNQKEHYGQEEYERIQKMNGRRADEIHGQSKNRYRRMDRHANTGDTT